MRYFSSTGNFPKNARAHNAKPSGDHIPLGGFVLTTAAANIADAPRSLAISDCLQNV
jgi:hypothetical protein